MHKPLLAATSSRLLALVCAVITPLAAQSPAPDRPSDEGRGPFDQLVIRGGIVISGTGGPPVGPTDITIEGNRIVSVGRSRPREGAEILDATGMYIMPGFVNLHAHTGAGKAPDTEYVYKLWMSHGITTVRGVALGPENWTLREKQRSDANEITAPRIVGYFRPPSVLNTPDEAREWVRAAAARGIDGLKLNSYRPEIMAALLEEANRLGLGSTAHLAQTGVAEMNAIDAARLGLRNITHFYGIFEAIYKDHDVQPWPVDMNYSDEQFRFGQVARQWNLIYPQGSEQWNGLLEEFLDLGTILDPTMTAYLASRDVMRAKNADWHKLYTLPSLWNFYDPAGGQHGSYFFDWTTTDEVAWKNFYRVWMAFLDDYKDMGGRVTVSGDAAYIYSLWGFASIEEMELLQEAGFHPLEVIRGATKHGAEAIFEPKGRPIEYGVIRPGLLADLVLIKENPLQNLKVLYGTGWPRLNKEAGRMEQIGGIDYTIKDGIVYDAKKLLADVREMVIKAEAARK